MNYHFPVHYHSPLPYQMSTGNRPINAITSKRISQLQEIWHQYADCLTVFSPHTSSQWHLDKHSLIDLSTASQRRSHRTRPPSPPRRRAGRWTRPHRTPCCASPQARSARREPRNCSARRSWCFELPSVVEGTWAQKLFEDSVACGASMSSWPQPAWRQLSGNRRRRQRWQKQQRGGDTTSWCRGLELVWEHQGLYRRQDTYAHSSRYQRLDTPSSDRVDVLHQRDYQIVLLLAQEVVWRYFSRSITMENLSKS